MKHSKLFSVNEVPQKGWPTSDRGIRGGLDPALGRILSKNVVTDKQRSASRVESAELFN